MGRIVRTVVLVVGLAGVFGTADVAHARGFWYGGGYPVVAGPVFAPRPAFVPGPVVVARPIYPAPVFVGRPIYPAPVIAPRPFYPAPVVVAPYRYGYRTAWRGGRYVW